MNERMAKKLRKYSRRAWWEYEMMIRTWPLRVRLWFAWRIITKAK